MAEPFTRAQLVLMHLRVQQLLQPLCAEVRRLDPEVYYTTGVRFTPATQAAVESYVSFRLLPPADLPHEIVPIVAGVFVNDLPDAAEVIADIRSDSEAGLFIVMGMPIQLPADPAQIMTQVEALVQDWPQHAGIVVEALRRQVTAG